MDENNNFQPQEQPVQPVQPVQPAQQQAYAPVPQQPVYAVAPQQATPAPSNGMSVAALVLGIVGLVLGFVPYLNYVVLVCCILGIVFGIKGRNKSAALGQPSGVATAGLILAIIGTVFAAIGVICMTACICTACAAASTYGDVLGDLDLNELEDWANQFGAIFLMK